jgi:hypothetical protein
MLRTFNVQSYVTVLYVCGRSMPMANNLDVLMQKFTPVSFPSEILVCHFQLELSTL